MKIITGHEKRAGRKPIRGESMERTKEAINAAFHRWHVQTRGVPYIEYGLRGAIALQAEEEARK